MRNVGVSSHDVDNGFEGNKLQCFIRYTTDLDLRNSRSLVYNLNKEGDFIGLLRKAHREKVATNRQEPDFFISK